MKERKMVLPQGEIVTIIYENDNDLLIKKILWNGIDVYDLILSLNQFDKFDVFDYLYDKLAQLQVKNV